MKLLALVVTLVAGSASAAEISVSITGALAREGSFLDGRDGAMWCGEERIYPAPSGPDAPPPPHLPPIWKVQMNPYRSPPEASFLLMFQPHPHGRERTAFLRLTAAGRVWEGYSHDDGAGIELAPAPGFLTGSFTLRNVVPTGGGTERITVTGRWRCPAGSR